MFIYFDIIVNLSMNQLAKNHRKKEKNIVHDSLPPLCWLASLTRREERQRKVRAVWNTCPFGNGSWVGTRGLHVRGCGARGGGRWAAAGGALERAFHTAHASSAAGGRGKGKSVSRGSAWSVLTPCCASSVRACAMVLRVSRPARERRMFPICRLSAFSHCQSCMMVA